MRAVYRKSDGSYVDNEQSWAIRPPNLAEAVARKHGGTLVDYVVFETTEPSLKQVKAGSLEVNQAKVDAVNSASQAAQAKTAMLKRISKRDFQAKVDAATAAGDQEAADYLQTQKGVLGAP